MRLIEGNRRKDQESMSKEAQERAIRSKRLIILIKLLNEQFTIKSISWIAILSTYWITNISVAYFCWLWIALSVIAIVIRLVIDFRYGIPDKSHKKTVC
jgi:hypothetical protein